MSETIKQLEWEYIDKNDNIQELIDKINFNFGQFALYNGGTPGEDGQDGADGMITKSRCIIHYIKTTLPNELEYSSEEIADYFNSNYEEFINDDIVIYGPCIYSFEKSDSTTLFNSNDFSLISHIYGDKGDKGDKGDSNDNFFKNISINGATENDNRLCFGNKSTRGIILEDIDNINISGIPIDWETDTEYSLIFSKNNKDGLSFLKVVKDEDSQVRKIDTQIQHIITSDSEGTTESSEFMITDASSEGSSYFSNNNKLSINSIKNGNDYKYKIILGEKKTITSSKGIQSINNGINLYSDDDIYFTHNNSLNILLGNTKQIELTKSLLNITNISDISSSGNLSISGKISSSSLNISGNTILNNTKIYNDTLSGVSLVNSNEVTKWYISKTGIASFQEVDVNNNNINNVFSRLDSGLTQFVQNYDDNKDIDTNTLDSSKQKKLRDQIGAISSDDLNNALKDKNFIIYTYSPIGSIIMSGKDTDTWIMDEVGGLYRKCNGDTIDNNINITINGKTVKIDLSGFGVGTLSYTLPDFGGRFPVGYGYNGNNNYTKLLELGGSDSVTLKVQELPEHNHKYVGDEEMWGKNPYTPFGASANKIKKGGSDNGDGKLYYTTNTGDGKAHENRPPYCVVTYYMKIQNSSN